MAGYIARIEKGIHIGYRWESQEARDHYDYQNVGG
jgi:hypothetical protein